MAEDGDRLPPELKKTKSRGTPALSCQRQDKRPLTAGGTAAGAG